MTVLLIIDGELNDLVRAAIVGSLLGCLLFLPGLSMTCGGIKHREQAFNPEGAGVSNVLLLVSITGIFLPTIFYQIYGLFEFDCTDCHTLIHPNTTSYTLHCDTCSRTQYELTEDKYFTEMAKYRYIYILTIDHSLLLWQSYYQSLISLV